MADAETTATAEAPANGNPDGGAAELQQALLEKRRADAQAAHNEIQEVLARYNCAISPKVQIDLSGLSADWFVFPK